MRKFTKVIAITAAMTMLFSTVVMAATSPSTTTVVSDSLSTANLAPTTVVTAYSAGIAVETAGVVAAPVNAATVNNANLAAKALLGPTATVLKAMALTGDTKSNVSVAVAGLVDGQQVSVLAYDVATGTWNKISCKVKNGKITFKKGGYSIFSIVSSVVAP